MPILPFSDHKRPVLLGHRGVSSKGGDNTRAAFLAALAAGLDGIETDVQRTRDGVLVIHHDFVAGPRLVFELTYDELRGLVPGIMTLAELFELFEQHPNFLINLELKSIPGLDDGRAYELAAAVGDWEGKRRVWISSYDPVALLKIRQHRPEIPLGYLFRVYDTGRMAEMLGIEAVHPQVQLVTAPRVARWHRKGLAVATWTVNDAATARELAGLGVDVIMGDDAEVLKQAR